MKRGLLLGLILYISVVITGCNFDIEQTNDDQPIYTPVVNVETPTPTTPSPPPSSATLEEITVIDGEMFYKDIEVALLFEYPFRDILGDPLRMQLDGAYLGYDGLEIVGVDWNAHTESFDMASRILGLDWALFNIDGITLDKTRDELIETFGATYVAMPLGDVTWMMKYTIILRDIEYVLEFWFDYPEMVARMLTVTPVSPPAPRPTPEPITAIDGEVFYKDVEVALLFEYPFRDILGDPPNQRGERFLFYDGLEIVGADWNEYTESFDMASQVLGTNLALFTIDGIALDKTRDDLIETFGATPDDLSFGINAYMVLRYTATLREVDYVLEFWFDYPDAVTRMLSILPIAPEIQTPTPTPNPRPTPTPRSMPTPPPDLGRVEISFFATSNEELAELVESGKIPVGVTHLYAEMYDVPRVQISDLTPLSGLTNLVELHLWHIEVSDLTPLANLTNLRVLTLGDMPISDLTPLVNLTNLTELRLNFTQISDLTPLANLVNLTRLDLSSNSISDITPLVDLTNLTSLRLNNNQVTDWSPVEHMDRVHGRP